MIKGVFGNMVLIELEKETEDSKVLDNGTEIWLDTEIDRLWHARQYGTIRFAAKGGAKRVEDNIQLEEGDRVYFHHFVIDSLIELDGDKFYKADINQIYAKEDKDGNIVMLQDYIFVEPVTNSDQLETKSGIITGTEEEIDNQGIVKHINQFTEKVIDMKVGDRIVFTKHSNYKMNIGDAKYYRMRDYDALAVIG